MAPQVFSRLKKKQTPKEESREEKARKKAGDNLRKPEATNKGGPGWSEISRRDLPEELVRVDSKD
jgi:hypothetical protein